MRSSEQNRPLGLLAGADAPAKAVEAGGAAVYCLE